MSPIPRLKPHRGPALLSYGFRPFFFFGACYSALVMGVWLALFEGEIQIPTLLSPLEWHTHELLLGYVPAVLAGFLLTAIPNWTGRLPLQGAPLLLLVVVWALGRGAVTFSTYLGWLSSAIIDTAFLVLVIAAAGREISAGRNWRNLKVLAPVAVLACANAGFHLEAHFFGLANYAMRVAITAILVLIMLIGGRIVPSFTRNWLARENPGRLPVPFGRFDAAAIGISGAALLAWIFAPAGALTGTGLLVAGILQLIRLVRWAGDRTIGERLVFILHVAYAFVPAGFILVSLAGFGIVPASAGIHAWTVGAVGVITIAVMTRASLGHTGSPLTATAGTHLIYVTVVLAALLRVLAALFPFWASSLIQAAAFSWIIAFGSFALLYGPILFQHCRSLAAP